MTKKINKIIFNDIPLKLQENKGYTPSFFGLEDGEGLNVVFSFSISDCQSVFGNKLENIEVLPYEMILYIGKIIQEISCFADIKFHYVRRLSDATASNLLKIAICGDLDTNIDRHLRDDIAETYFSFDKDNEVGISASLLMYDKLSNQNLGDFYLSNVASSLLRLFSSYEPIYIDHEEQRKFPSMSIYKPDNKDDSSFMECWNKNTDLLESWWQLNDEILTNLKKCYNLPKDMTLIDASILDLVWGTSQDDDEICNNIRAKFASENSEYVSLEEIISDDVQADL